MLKLRSNKSGSTQQFRAGLFCMVSALLALCLVFFPRTVYAEQREPALHDAARLNDQFIQTMNGFFEAGSTYIAIGRTGEDVTHCFRSSHYREYLANDFAALHNAFIDELIGIQWREVPVGSRTMLLPTEKTQRYFVIRSNDGMGYGGEALATLSITYQLNDSIGKITGANSPVLSVEYFMGDSIYANTIGASTWKTLATNGSRLDYGASFSVQMSATPENLPVWSGWAGPYSMSAVVYP